MKIVFTSRSLDMGNAFKEKFTEKLQSLNKFFKNDKKEASVEVVSRKVNDRTNRIHVELTCSRGVFESDEIVEDIYSAIPICINELKIQLIKAKKNNREEKARIAGKHSRVTEDDE